MKIGIGASKKIIVGKKKDADRSGIGIEITGTARSSSIAGSKILSFLLSEIALNAMVMIGMIDQIGSIKTVTTDLIGRIGRELQSMIGWGVDSVCMTRLVIVLTTFPGTKRSLRRWQMLEFPTSSYFVEMLILTEWSRGKFIVHR